MYDKLSKKSEIKNCYSTGSILCEANKGYIYGGGLIGRLCDSTVEYAYATGNVYCKNVTYDSYAAGLIVTIDKSSVKNAFSTGAAYAHGNSQGKEANYSYYGHLFAAANSSTLSNLYYDANDPFKTAVLVKSI